MKVVGKKNVEDAPKKPGAYLWKNRRGKVIYVGKAKDIRKRLGWYLDDKKLDAKTRLLMREAEDVDYIVTDSETEALILESTLIKKHEPKYNVDLKDGKKYPYIKLDISGEFPRLCITRRVEDDGGGYYGPYPDVSAMKRVYKTAQRMFGLRTCRGDVRKKKPCLKYHIKRCVGPCTGKVGRREYDTRVTQARMLFSGKTRDLLRELEGKMRMSSKKQRFEDAAEIRDLIYAIEKSGETRKTEFVDGRDVDVLGYAREGQSAGVSVLIIRDGRVLSHFFHPIGGEFRGDSVESLRSFIKQYYAPRQDLPGEIILRDKIEDVKSIQMWLSKKRGKNVKVVVPSRGVKSELVSLAEKNARHAVSLEEAALSAPKPGAELAGILSLSSAPKRIEAYDISNIGGDFAVGSMIVFVGGEADKKEYRRFRIKSVSGADDVAMIREVLERRRGRVDWSKPDLVLIDGGKPQLNAALEELGGWGVPVVALAKQEEDVYVEGKKKPLKLDKNSAALKLLISARDEAHRFALRYHRAIRRNGMLN